jgi:hypothetical protein
VHEGCAPSPCQDKSYKGLKSKGVSLAGLLNEAPKKHRIAQPEPITRYTTSRLRRPPGLPRGQRALLRQQVSILASDPAVKLYLSDLAHRRNNNGILSPGSLQMIRSSVLAFVFYSSLPITDHSISDLVQYKRDNPQSTNIELALKSFSLEPNVPMHSNQASRIQGIFRANFAPLQLRVNTHFAPAEENCTKGIFLAIYKRLTREQQDMIQWGLYVPERAKAAYRVPFQDIDVTRFDYAIVKIAGAIPNANGIRSKMRVDHPCLVPIEFAKRVIANSKAAGNNCPFPSHEWLWAQVSRFARDEFEVKLRSNYTRKLFESAAQHSTLLPSIAAFIMGDKTKLAATGHLPLIYNPELRPMEREQFIQDYKNSGIDKLLDIHKSDRHPTATTVGDFTIRVERNKTQRG